MALSVPLEDRPKFAGTIGAFSQAAQIIAPFLGGQYPRNPSIKPCVSYITDEPELHGLTS
jgi:hypothetical protein